ncbi:HPr family phosphocarrier protein [Parasphingorhabdus sp.]|uniref:HPr family phosphocarrier protein n=1 Tax=Parasphingorhabdus sp. TaxID=2709688 RepID=UPI0030022DC7
MNELRKTVMITNSRGLHARASAKFVTYVSKLPAGVDVRVAKDGSEVTGTSIMGLMMLGAAKGDSVEIIVTGEQAESALEKLTGLVVDGFGED